MLWIVVDVYFRQTRRSRLPVAACAAIVSMSCVRIGFETLGSGGALGESGPANSGGVATGGTAGIGGGAGGSTGTVGGAAASTGGTAGTVSSPTCVTRSGYVNAWTFDTSEQGFTLNVDAPLAGTLSWINTDGHANAGALQATVSLNGTSLYGYFRSPESNLGNLAGRLVTAYIKLQSGNPVSVKIYALDVAWNWADGGWTTLSSGSWTCLSFDPAVPIYAVSGYSSSSIIELGVQFWGNGDTRVLLDDLGY